MKIEHTIHPELLRRAISIALIGAGGTGSALLPRLMQLHFAMLELGHPAGLHVTVFDDDTVSKANIGRQCFFPADVGQNKAMLLVNRLNATWGTQWNAFAKRLTGDDHIQPDIVIGCVDTRKARSTILKAIGTHHCYYIDAGNNENSGQVVLGELEGTARRPGRLPTVADLFPEMVDPSLDAVDDKPSCSVAEALKKQSLVINAAMATEVFNLLWILVRTGTLKYSGRFVNLETGSSTPLRLDAQVWKRMGYVDPAMDEENIRVYGKAA